MNLSIPIKKKLIIFIILFFIISAIIIRYYPSLKHEYLNITGESNLIFLDETDSAGMKRHHSKAAWLSSFSVSVVDNDNDGDNDIFVNNHERNRPYFYRNNSDGTFSEVHEAIGLLENDIGPIFGKPDFNSNTPGFYLWLDPEISISGMWHLMWIGESGKPVPIKGELRSNTKIEKIEPVNISSREEIIVDDNIIRFDTFADQSIRGINFKSVFPESTIEIDLSFNGEVNKSKIFIGPRSVNPDSLPFNLSLGDRHATVWGDFNNDGYSDLFITRGAMVGVLKPPYGAKQEELFANNANFHFSNVIKSSNIRNDYGRGRDAQWVDYDNNGLLDLYISNIKSRNLLYKNTGNGVFHEVAKDAGLDFLGRTHFSWADFNNDGLVDIFLTNPNGLFLNKGKGIFVDVTKKSRLNTVKKYENEKDALFWGSGASAADFDNDGDLDIFVASGKGGGKSNLFENQNGLFIDIADKTGIDFLENVIEGIWGDFDNDGHVDLYTIGSSPESNRLFMNNGNMTFIDVTEEKNLSFSGRLEWELSSRAGGVGSWVDYDNDGFLDLFLATRRIKGSFDNDPEINKESEQLYSTFIHSIRPVLKRFMKDKVRGTHFLFNNSGNDNHWIKINLSGNTSNRDGLGAKVFVKTNGITQFQEAGVRAKMLFAQNYVPLHFGLGDADSVKSIKVIWPSGKQQVLENVSSKQIIQIVEP